MKKYVLKPIKIDLLMFAFRVRLKTKPEDSFFNCFILVQKFVYGGIWNVQCNSAVTCSDNSCRVQSCSQELLKYLKYWFWIPPAQTHPLIFILWVFFSGLWAVIVIHNSFIILVEENYAHKWVVLHCTCLSLENWFQILSSLQNLNHLLFLKQTTVYCELWVQFFCLDLN